jgi:hypothetical protein
MKNWSLVSAKYGVALCLVAALFTVAAARAAEPLRVRARLVWGTNEEKSPDKNHKPVEPALAKRMTNAFKWKYYFEVNEQKENIAPGQTKRLKMSDHCTVDIKFLPDGRAEVKLFGEGKPISSITQPLREDWPLILSGNAKNDTAWLVVIERTAPPDKEAKPKPK